MTTTRTSTSRRSLRGAALALVTGAGIALTPLPASAATGDAPAPARVAPAVAPVSAAPAPARVAAAPARVAAAPARVALAAAPVSAAPVAAPNSAAQIAVDTALAQLGKPYVWGGTGPHGYDCSGLTWSAYQAAGVTLPRTSRAQSTAGVHVDRASLRPGDLIFFYKPVGHVAMYIGNGLMVQSSTFGQPVNVVPVDSMWGYNTARRVV